MGKKLDDVVGSSERKWEEEFKRFKFDRPEQIQFRLLGDLFVFGRHWVATKPHDIDAGKKFPRECVNFDPVTETAVLKRNCQCCEARKTAPEKSISEQKQYFINAIDREAQEASVRNPIVALGPLPPTLIDKIIELKSSNRAKGDKEGYHVTHPEFGRDVLIKFDNSKSGADKWAVSIDGSGRSPLTEAELAYKQIDFDSVYPNFGDSAVLESYNKSTRDSLSRQGYFESEAPRERSSRRAPTSNDPPSKMKSVSDDEEGTSEDPEPETVAPRQSRREAPAPAEKVEATETEDVGPPPKLNLVSAAAAAPAAAAGKPGKNECPHQDEEHQFGSFRGDMLCMKCPNKMGCVAASSPA